MRWDNLFDDLESQLEHELGVDDAQLRIEEERLRLGRVSLRERLRAIAGDPASGAHAAGAVSPIVGLWLRDGSLVRVSLTTFGRDWVAGEVSGEGVARGRRTAASARVLVSLDAVTSVAVDDAQVRAGLAAEAEAERPDAPPRLIDRLGFAFALRDLARRRNAVAVTTTTGTVRGTIDRVARDHFDLAVHEPETPRRSVNVREVRVIPIAAVLLVRF